MEEKFDFHDGHRERLRHRVEVEGVDVLESHQLVEFLLCYAIPRQDLNDLAHALLDHFGGLEELFCAGADELEQVEGMGRTAAEWLEALGEFYGACSMLEFCKDNILKNYGQIFELSRRLRRIHQSPRCIQISMDEKGRVIYQTDLGDSLKWAEPEKISRAYSDAISCNARYVILLFCAGKRVSYPSNYDRDKVREYARLLNLADISLLDMAITGSTGTMSLRRMNFIPEQNVFRRRLALREDYIASIPPLQDGE